MTDATNVPATADADDGATPVAAEPAEPAQAAAAVDSESLPAGILDKLKSILLTVGHDIEAVWDEAVALAKKLV